MEYTDKHIIFSIKDFPASVRTAIVSTLDINGFLADDKNFRKLVADNLHLLGIKGDNLSNLTNIVLSGQILPLERDAESGQIGLNFHYNIYKITLETLPGQPEKSGSLILDIIGIDKATGEYILAFSDKDNIYRYAGKVKPFLKREELFDIPIKGPAGTTWFKPKKKVKVKHKGLQYSPLSAYKIKSDVVKENKLLSAIGKGIEVEGVVEGDSSLQQIAHCGYCDDKPLIAIDFDGTLSTQMEDHADFGPPIPGAIEAVKKFKEQGFEVIVFSHRVDYPGGLEEIIEWLKAYNCPIDKIWIKEKPAAKYFIDDRSIAFTGNWDEAFKEIQKRQGIQKIAKPIFKFKCLHCEYENESWERVYYHMMESHKDIPYPLVAPENISRILPVVVGTLDKEAKMPSLKEIQKIVDNPAWQKLRKDLSWTKDNINKSLKRLRQYLGDSPSKEKKVRVLNLLNGVARGGIMTPEIKRLQHKLRNEIGVGEKESSLDSEAARPKHFPLYTTTYEAAIQRVLRKEPFEPYSPEKLKEMQDAYERRIPGAYKHEVAIALRIGETTKGKAKELLAERPDIIPLYWKWRREWYWANIAWPRLKNDPDYEEIKRHITEEAEKRRVQDPFAATTPKGPQFKEGDEVLIASGPFKSHTGLFQSYNQDGTSEVLVEIFNKVNTITVPTEDLRPTKSSDSTEPDPRGRPQLIEAYKDRFPLPKELYDTIHKELDFMGQLLIEQYQQRVFPSVKSLLQDLQLKSRYPLYERQRQIIKRINELTSPPPPVEEPVTPEGLDKEAGWGDLIPGSWQELFLSLGLVTAPQAKQVPVEVSTPAVTTPIKEEVRQVSKVAVKESLFKLWDKMPAAAKARAKVDPNILVSEVYKRLQLKEKDPDILSYLYDTAREYLEKEAVDISRWTPDYVEQTYKGWTEYTRRKYVGMVNDPGTGRVNFLIRLRDEISKQDGPYAAAKFIKEPDPDIKKRITDLVTEEQFKYYKWKINQQDQHGSFLPQDYIRETLDLKKEASMEEKIKELMDWIQKSFPEASSEVDIEKYKIMSPEQKEVLFDRLLDLMNKNPHMRDEYIKHLRRIHLGEALGYTEAAFMPSFTGVHWDIRPEQPGAPLQSLYPAEPGDTDRAYSKPQAFKDPAILLRLLMGLPKKKKSKALGEADLIKTSEDTMSPKEALLMAKKNKNWAGMIDIAIKHEKWFRDHAEELGTKQAEDVVTNCKYYIMMQSIKEDPLEALKYYYEFNFATNPKLKAFITHDELEKAILEKSSGVIDSYVAAKNYDNLVDQLRVKGLNKHLKKEFDKYVDLSKYADIISEKDAVRLIDQGSKNGQIKGISYIGKTIKDGIYLKELFDKVHDMDLKDVIVNQLIFLYKDTGFEDGIDYIFKKSAHLEFLKRILKTVVDKSENPPAMLGEAMKSRFNLLQKYAFDLYIDKYLMMGYKTPLFADKLGKVIPDDFIELLWGADHDVKLHVYKRILSSIPVEKAPLYQNFITMAAEDKAVYDEDSEVSQIIKVQIGNLTRGTLPEEKPIEAPPPETGESVPEQLAFPLADDVLSQEYAAMRKTLTEEDIKTYLDKREKPIGTLEDIHKELASYVTRHADPKEHALTDEVRQFFLLLIRYFEKQGPKGPPEKGPSKQPSEDWDGEMFKESRQPPTTWPSSGAWGLDPAMPLHTPNQDSLLLDDVRQFIGRPLGKFRQRLNDLWRVIQKKPISDKEEKEKENIEKVKPLSFLDKKAMDTEILDKLQGKVTEQLEAVEYLGNNKDEEGLKKAVDSTVDKGVLLAIVDQAVENNFKSVLRYLLNKHLLSEAVSALGEVKDAEGIITLLDSTDYNIRQEAVKQLAVTFGERDILRQKLSDADSITKILLIYYLGVLEDKETLKEYALDPNKDVQKMALKWLAHYGETSFLDSLKDKLDPSATTYTEDQLARHQESAKGFGRMSGSDQTQQIKILEEIANKAFNPIETTKDILKDIYKSLGVRSKDALSEREKEIRVWKDYRIPKELPSLEEGEKALAKLEALMEYVPEEVPESVNTSLRTDAQEQQRRMMGATSKRALQYIIDKLTLAKKTAETNDTKKALEKIIDKNISLKEIEYMEPEFYFTVPYGEVVPNRIGKGNVSKRHFTHNKFWKTEASRLRRKIEREEYPKKKLDWDYAANQRERYEGITSLINDVTKALLPYTKPTEHVWITPEMQELAKGMGALNVALERTPEYEYREANWQYGTPPGLYRSKVYISRADKLNYALKLYDHLRKENEKEIFDSISPAGKVLMEQLRELNVEKRKLLRELDKLDAIPNVSTNPEEWKKQRLQEVDEYEKYQKKIEDEPEIYERLVYPQIYEEVPPELEKNRLYKMYLTFQELKDKGVV